MFSIGSLQMLEGCNEVKQNYSESFMLESTFKVIKSNHKPSYFAWSICVFSFLYDDHDCSSTLKMWTTYFGVILGISTKLCKYWHLFYLRIASRDDKQQFHLGNF